MIRTSQQHLAIIDYPEGRLQQVRWSVAAFLGLGFEVLLRRDGRCYRPIGRRPYLGREIDPSEGLAQTPDLVWTVPAGALPTMSLIGRLEETIPEGRTDLGVARGALCPGLGYLQATGHVRAGNRARAWVAHGCDVGREKLCTPLTMPGERAQASLYGLVNPFIREPWQTVEGPTRSDMRPAIWETGRSVLSQWRRGRPGSGLWQGVRGVPAIIGRRREDCRRLPPITTDGEFSVTYILDRLVIAGGVLSVIQLVNELILLGVDARIACLFEDPAIYRWQPLLTRPMVFRNARELISELPETQLAVATLWKTAPWVADLKRRAKASQTAYFLQDYEPWFFPTKRRQARRRVIETYGLIDHRIVKSDWLAEKLGEHGYASTKIPLGLNLDVFHPGPLGKRKKKTIMAMARPGTPQRGFTRLTETLRLLDQRHPNLNIELFGSRRLNAGRLGVRCRSHGIVDDPSYLAELYRRAEVFVDTSDFQGLGRCALEAMACGTACVLTAAGGVGEYARDQVNAIMVKSGNAGEIAVQVERLLADAPRREALAAEGLKTAARFDLQLEAERTRDYFRSILGLAPEPKP